MYQLLMLPVSLLAQAALACMRDLRRLRLIRCRFQDPQMPGLPNILGKAPSLTVHIGRLLRLYNGCASTHQFAPKAAADMAIGRMLVQHAVLLYLLLLHRMACKSDGMHAGACL